MEPNQSSLVIKNPGRAERYFTLGHAEKRDALEIGIASGDLDGDDIPDVVEGRDDLDQDDAPNYADSDADNDGVTDKEEGVTDQNGDGQPDFLDRIRPQARPELQVMLKDYLLIDADGDQLVSQGDILLYRVTIVNVGDGPAYEVEIEFIPQGDMQIVRDSFNGQYESTPDVQLLNPKILQVKLGSLTGGRTITSSFQTAIVSRPKDGTFSAQVDMRYEDRSANSRGQKTVLSDDPDTRLDGDPTDTPFGQSIPRKIIDTLFLPLVVR
ncbi:hypothetical protein KFU94_62720 [Chloroflexi bacterium TSY]|nr:hypothetical protein [Chloroflexi bacterium TSY]